LPSHRRRTNDLKVLIKLFQKFARVEAAEASSRSAEREILLRRFSLLSETREAISASLRASFHLAPI
jgi:outer membrane protein TolC